MYFMYQHCQFCLSGIEKSPEPSPDIFTLFPLLPSELRLKIWQVIANTPRFVELTCTPTSSHLPEGKWFSHSKSPVIFRISPESRGIALSLYSTLTFSPSQMGIPCSTPLRINFSADTLWLCGDLHATWARNLLEKNEQLKEKLKFLSVKEKLWKELNEVEVIDSLRKVSKEAVLKGLKAIEDITSHK
jgi:hypothetical protein